MATGTAKATWAAVGLLLQSMAAKRQELGFRNLVRPGKQITLVSEHIRCSWVEG